MSFRTQAAVLGVAPIALFVSTPIHANGHDSHASHDEHYYSGPYIGASVSRSRIDADIGGAFDELDVRDRGYKAFLGYAFNEHLRLEVGLVEFGELDETLEFGPIGIQDVDLKADGITAALEFAVPLSEALSVSARGGVVAWETKISASTLRATEDGDDPFYGLGARYRFGNNLSLVGSYERYKLDNVDVNLASVGLSLDF